MRTPPRRTACWATALTTFGMIALGGATLGACGGAVTPPHAPWADTRRLAGVWNAMFVLDAPPLGFDSAALRALPERRVPGTLVFVPNHWLTSAAVTGVGLPGAPTLYGTYDVDFRPFGFDPRDADRVPDAVATTPTSGGPASADSVTLVLGPSSDREQVTLVGVLRADSVVGTWRLQGAGRPGMTAGGRFILVAPPAAAPRPMTARATFGARGILHRAGGAPGPDR